MNNDAPSDPDPDVPASEPGGLRARLQLWHEHLSESQKDALRLVLIVLGLAVLAGATYFLAGPSWRGWRQRQALRQAIEYAERQDHRGSMLALKRAIDLAPLDLATWREIAERLAEIGSPQSVFAHENLVRLAPGDISLRLALVEEALRFGQTDAADLALAGLDEAARSDANFHRLAAALAMATGQAALLEEHLASLASLTPDDHLARFNLAALRIWSLDEAKRSEGLAELEALTAEPSTRVRAGLELLKHAARVRDADRARQVVDLLLARLPVPELPPSAATDDGSPAGWRELIAALKADAARAGGPEVELVARWMGEVRLRREALDWIDTLPAELRDSQPVQRAEVSLGADTEDQERLARLLRAGALGPLADDTVQLALTSRLQRRHYREAHGRGTWRDAITSCRSNPAALGALATLAELWRDPVGNEEALLAVLETQPQATWVFEALRNNYLARGETVRLWQLYEKWVRATPADSGIARTWLHLGAVLDRMPPEAITLARQRAESPGADPLDLCLAAASAWRLGESVEAFRILDTIPVAARTRADVAFWIAVIWSGSPHAEHQLLAQESRLRAQRPGLSLEERALLEKIAAKQG
jgi:hypothetical protein